MQKNLNYPDQFSSHIANLYYRWYKHYLQHRYTNDYEYYRYLLPEMYTPHKYVYSMTISLQWLFRSYNFRWLSWSFPDIISCTTAAARRVHRDGSIYLVKHNNDAYVTTSWELNISIYLNFKLYLHGMKDKFILSFTYSIKYLS